MSANTPFPNKAISTGPRGHTVDLSFGGHHSAILEKAMAPHSSTLAWKIPWTEKSGGLQSMGLLRVGHD